MLFGNICDKFHYILHSFSRKRATWKLLLVSIYSQSQCVHSILLQKPTESAFAQAVLKQERLPANSFSMVIEGHLRNLALLFQSARELSQTNCSPRDRGKSKHHHFHIHFSRSLSCCRRKVSHHPLDHSDFLAL